MNVIQEIQRINERELALGIFGGSYRDFLCGGGHLSDCAYSVG